MIEAPVVVETTAQAAAVIHLTIPRDQVEKFMDPAIREVLAALRDQGQALAGPLFSRHLTTSPAVFDFEVGFPVNAPIVPAGRVKPGELQGGTVVRSVYQGPYEGLFGAWKEFGEWLKKNGFTPAGTLWERYVTGPETSPDPADWRTELNRRLES